MDYNVAITVPVRIRIPTWTYSEIKSSADKKGIPVATEIKIRLCENCKK